MRRRSIACPRRRAPAAHHGNAPYDPRPMTFDHSLCCIRLQARAHQLMTKTLHSCSPEDSMDSALELMNRIKARSTHHYDRIILMAVTEPL